MCIIAAIPQGKQISKEVLKRCWHNNPHGGGFMYTNGKQVQTFKEMSSFKRYWKSFVNLRNEFPQSSFVCHFRISTHGKVNEDNCHPFLVNNKLGFVHNGIIRNAPLSSDYSDTYMFNEAILKQLPSNFLGNQSILTLIEEYIGGGSKLSFLTYDNQLHFVNEKAGVWDEGIWFSNRGYQSGGYYDRGGVQVSTPYSTKVNSYSGSNYGGYGTQQKIGFASAAFPPTNPKPIKEVVHELITDKPYNSDEWGWESRILTDKKVERDILGYSKSSYADKYAIKCTYCDNTLNSYVEKNNEVCQKCCDRYEREWAI
jgi:glutamine amidotransferase